MSWSSGAHANLSPGFFLGILEAALIANAHWTVYDATAGVDGATRITNGDFSAGNTGWTVGAGWSTATGKCVHTAGGGTATVAQTTSQNDGFYYDLIVTVAGRTAGTLTITVSGTSGGPLVISADGTYTLRLLATTGAPVFTFTPTTTFDGNFDDVSYCEKHENCKVFECRDDTENVLFYFYVDDQHDNWACVAIWEGWNAGTHAGTGLSWGGTNAYAIRRSIGLYGISVHDHFFQYADRVGGWHYYVGQTRRFDVTKNMPVMIVHGFESAYSPVGVMPQMAGFAQWVALFDQDGLSRTINPYGYAGVQAVFFPIKTTNGKYWLLEHPVCNTNDSKLIGQLEGCSSIGIQSSYGLVAEDTVLDTEDVSWLVIIGSVGVSRGISLLRMN